MKMAPNICREKMAPYLPPILLQRFLPSTSGDNFLATSLVVSETNRQDNRQDRQTHEGNRQIQDQ